MSTDQKSGLPPVITATLQAAVLSIASNILAQAITVYRHDEPFVLDWVPVFQFTVFNCLITPPNFVWQTFLENTFPAYGEPSAPKLKADADLKKDAKQPEPQLHKFNTFAKFALDQTIGAIINTFLFATFINAIKMAMAHRDSSPAWAGAENSMSFLLSGKPVVWENVNWDVVLEKTSEQFNSIIIAGWQIWPAVSFVNFALVKTVEMRSLVGNAAGLVWGVYMSLFEAAH